MNSFAFIFPLSSFLSSSVDVKEVPPTRPVKVIREIPPTRQREDDLSDLIIPDSNREDFIEHSNILLEYDGEFDVEKYARWMDDLSKRRGLVLKNLTVVSARGKTCALVNWTKRLRSKCRHILDYKGMRPVLRRAYLTKYRERIHWHLEKMRKATLSK